MVWGPGPFSVKKGLLHPQKREFNVFSREPFYVSGGPLLRGSSRSPRPLSGANHGSTAAGWARRMKARQWPVADPGLLQGGGEARASGLAEAQEGPLKRKKTPRKIRSISRLYKTPFSSQKGPMLPIKDPLVPKRNFGAKGTLRRQKRNFQSEIGLLRTKRARTGPQGDMPSTLWIHHGPWPTV